MTFPSLAGGPNVRVLVVGEFKPGKSQLVNAPFNDSSLFAASMLINST